MKIVGAEIVLYVKSMAESRAFYGNQLGLPVTYDGGDYWVTFDLGGTSLAIHPGGSGEQSHNRSGITLITDEIVALREKLNGLGAGFGEIENPHPGVTFATTRDPDGNPVYLKPSLD
ncbi:MAG: VOC family protein [Fimbriimonadaceae bacterium]